MGTEIYRRQDAPTEATWNKEGLFADWSAWEVGLAAAKDALGQIQGDRAAALKSPQALAQWLEQGLALHKQLNPLSVYANLAANVDSGDMQAKGFCGQIAGLWSQFGSTIGPFEAELAGLGDTLTDWIEQAPELDRYRHYFDNLLRLRQHMRSPEVEEILNAFSEPLGQVANTSSELMNTDLKFADSENRAGQRFPTLQSTITPTGIQDADRQRRRTAWEHYADGYQSMINTFASNYIAYAKAEVLKAKARGFTSVLEQRLAPSNLPVEVFHTLMQACRENAGIWHRYWEVKARALGVDQLHPYDIWAPVVAEPPEVDYRQGADWIVDSARPLGSEYVDILTRGVGPERWVDWAPNAGKRQGAFCASGPVVFTSYSGSLVDLSVLAHELGHAMHGYYRDREQPPIYAYHLGAGSALGETPSNFAQALLRLHLRREKGDDAPFQLALIDEAMFNFHRYFFQMPNLAQFELEFFERIWDGEAVNAPILNDIMQGIYARGYGDTMADDPARTATTWAQFPHLFMPFYTFQYAVGISAAHGMADRIDGGVPGAADDFIALLKAGSSLYPMELFKLGGVDMTGPEPIEKAFAVLAGLVDQMEALVS
ncbi:MAG: oligoendopeptidase F [Candidatus Latescibacteria bacterium]|nr:oligoendopeptidase F [Candidatus Latescibacterota bacterium]